MAEAKSKVVSVIPPFKVEVKHPRNCDIVLQGLTGVIERRLRSAISPSTRTIQGKPRTLTFQNQALPELPGMVLEVHPSKCAVRRVDPLRDNENAKNELARYLKNTNQITNTIPQGAETVQGKTNPDRMKTLCREIWYLLQAKEMELVEGSVEFTLEDCDGLPGEYLTNPGSLIPNGQPQYEKDMEAFRQRLNTSVN